ncbi:hypothetical protein [Pseudooctadecabacter jejudonensis]|uniref:Secreted protein n=1 Tax=Pseudooctadecabacter jejudonensis TaxID=1391910 RepID=A0A1Y5T8C0_9RHOB|nr:hypothetical protein [Pseudooctadecabacter jejudonensis]SLN56077.1 hypothetical protein PSJ8397_02966 [Pseudooctadecabacter jejudonensis]
MNRLLPLLFLATPAFADAPVIEDVTYSNGRFNVTLSHGDTGWDDYADGWRVELADGTVLGTRTLAHPHVDEQPFTRSSNIAVPAGVDVVYVRASDSVGGWATRTERFSIR